MTDWTQHPTRPLTAPDGRTVDIDLEMVPLVTGLWRLGFATKVACQDAGEAVANGGTRATPEEQPAAAARNMGRAWLVVKREDGPRLLEVWSGVGQPDEWVMQPVKKNTDPDGWVSITFPRRLIPAAVRALRPPAPSGPSWPSDVGQQADPAEDASVTMNLMTTLTPGAPYLVQPSEALRGTFLEAMREHQAVDGRPDAGGLTLADLEAGDCVACYTEGLRDGTALRTGTKPLEGCEWWLVEPDGHRGPTYLGRVSLYLNPSPRHGHLELAVRPSRRWQGHGARLLRLGLDLAHARSIEVARLVCWEGAYAARRLIESADGVLADRLEGGCFYQLNTGSAASRRRCDH